MNRITLNTVSFAGWVICVIIALLCLAHVIIGNAGVFALLAIAFALMPKTWR
jgi:hypothetical protein